MKRIINTAVTVFLFGGVMFLTGCSNDTPKSETVVTEEKAHELTVEEVNADRGDACECAEQTLMNIKTFTSNMGGATYATSQILNEEFTKVISGCMSLIGHEAADLAWTAELSLCETFPAIRQEMIKVRNRAVELKKQEEKAFANSSGNYKEGGSEGVLDRLRDGTQKN